MQLELAVNGSVFGLFCCFSENSLQLENKIRFEGLVLMVSTNVLKGDLVQYEIVNGKLMTFNLYVTLIGRISRLAGFISLFFPSRCNSLFNHTSII